MLNLSYKTRGNKRPVCIPKVFFTCHKDDFKKYGDVIINDILEQEDVAVYYTETPDISIAPDEYDHYISQMQLIVFPVTYKLLSTKNRAVSDIIFAREREIRILPIVVELGIEEEYNSKEYLKNRHFLDRTGEKYSKKSYQKKLERFLSELSGDNDLYGRIEGQFDVRCFLSYRKMDYRYVNKLMGMIHKSKENIGVSVWYDEYLLPGERFDDSILEKINGCDLFTLLITPNSPKLNENNEPNYVVSEEYPAAKGKKQIFPVEMEKTPKESLMCFKDLPECVPAEDERFFDAELSDRLKKIREDIKNKKCGENAVIKENADQTTERKYLLGYAYMIGYMVEFNSKRGLGLMTEAADEGNCEAAIKLSNYYRSTMDSAERLGKSLYYAEKAVSFCKEFDIKDRRRLSADLHLAHTYLYTGGTDNLNKAKDILQNDVINVLKKDPSGSSDLLIYAENSLVAVLINLGRYSEAETLINEIMSEEGAATSAEDTVTEILNLGSTLYMRGNIEKANDLLENSIDHIFEICGDGTESSALALNLWGLILCNGGHYVKGIEKLNTALAIKDAGFDLKCIIFNNLASAYADIGDFKNASDIRHKLCDIFHERYGFGHPWTLTMYNNLAYLYGQAADVIDDDRRRKKVLYDAIRILNDVHEARKKILGPTHPHTLNTYNNIALMYSKIPNYDKAIKINDDVLALRLASLPEDHPDVLQSRYNKAYLLKQKNRFDEAAEILKDVYEKRCRTSGISHPETLLVLSEYAETCVMLKDYPSALEYYKLLHKLSLELYGETHEKTQIALLELIKITFMINTPDELNNAFYWCCKICNDERYDNPCLLRGILPFCIHMMPEKFPSVKKRIDGEK